MEFKEFERRIQEINKELFKVEDSKAFGTCTYANISDDQQSVLIMGFNPNPSKEPHKRKTNNPLIYVPGLEETEMGEFFKKNDYTWNYKKAYDLLGDKAKMFWAADDVYLKDIAKAYPEYKEEWTKCYNTEKNKKTNLILTFVDLFSYCEGSQAEVIKKIKSNKDAVARIDEIVKLYIDFYKPKLIVVTNADASDLIYKSQYNKNRNRKTVNEMCLTHNGRNTKIMFGTAIHGQYIITPKGQEAYEKLKQRLNTLG